MECSSFAKFSLPNPCLKDPWLEWKKLHWLLSSTSLCVSYEIIGFMLPILFSKYHLWDHKFGIILHADPLFTMRKPAYIALERINHLRYIWGELRILLLELGIFPKIMVGLGVRIQLPSKIEKIFLSFSSTDQLLARIGSALSKGMSECYSAPGERHHSQKQ